METQYIINDRKNGGTYNVNGSLFVMKNSQIIKYFLIIAIIIFFIIIWLYNTGKLKYVSKKKVVFDEDLEKEKSAFKPNKSEKEDKPEKSNSKENSDIDKEIEELNSL